MTIASPPCGPHCGIRSNAEGTLTREGHCDCGKPCHPEGIMREVPPDVVTGAGRPMCARWYERAGDRRPWDKP